MDRARAIYAHCSQMCDPRITGDFWQTWKEFEIRHGNEDTMREMLRIKRSVQATYNTQINMMAAQYMGGASSAAAASTSDASKDAMKALEAKAAALAMQQQQGETNGGDTAAAGAAKSVTSGSNIMFVRGETHGVGDGTKVVNPDEIALDDDDSDEEEDGDDDDDEVEVPIQKQQVPSKVFGGLKKDDEEMEEGDEEAENA